MTPLSGFEHWGNYGFYTLISRHIYVFHLTGSTRQYAWCSLAYDIPHNRCRCIHGGIYQYDCMYRNSHQLPFLFKDCQTFLYPCHHSCLNICYKLCSIFDVKSNINIYDAANFSPIGTRWRLCRQRPQQLRFSPLLDRSNVISSWILGSGHHNRPYSLRYPYSSWLHLENWICINIGYSGCDSYSLSSCLSSLENKRKREPKRRNLRR